MCPVKSERFLAWNAPAIRSAGGKKEKARQLNENGGGILRVYMRVEIYIFRDHNLWK